MTKYTISNDFFYKL